MHVTRITDLDHEALADYNRLTDVALRRVSEPEGGLYIAESAKVIRRAIGAGHRPRSVLMEEKWLAGLESSLGAFEDKTATLSDADTVWADVRHMHMREAIDKLMADFNRFMADNAGFKGCVLARSLVRLLSFMRGCLLLWLPAFLPAFIHSFI